MLGRIWFASTAVIVSAPVAPAGAIGGGAATGAAATSGLIAAERYDYESHSPQIITLRPDGTHQRVLVRRADQPAWSPDGRWLAYTSQAPAGATGVAREEQRHGRTAGLSVRERG
jgi:Tol biopolymer transport system component